MIVLPEKFVPRSAWKARRPRHRSKARMDDVPTNHWNGPTITVKGKTTWDHRYCAGLVRGIQNFHMDGRGWSDIAYNFIPCPHGYIFEGRGINVINGANGTNTGNRTSHAVMCLAGEGNPFSDEEKRGVKRCVRYISERTNAPNRCKGHRDWKNTACPGDVRYDWVHKGMPVSGYSPKPSKPSTKPSTKGKDISMEAAILLIKIHYDNVRGRGDGSYDVEVKDRKGWTAWLNHLLQAQDAGKPLSEITGACAWALIQEAAGKK